MLRVGSIPEQISQTVISAVKKAKNIKGKYKEKQRILLNVPLFCSWILPSLTMFVKQIVKLKNADLTNITQLLK